MVDFWGTVGTLARVLAITAAIYAYLVVLLRLTGNRTLAKLRAFDFVVTIAIGSIVASTTVTGNNAGLMNGIVAVTGLVGLQWLVAFASTRSQRVNGLVTSPPVLLFHAGFFLEKNMRDARVTRDELELAMRRSGFEDSGDVGSVILEPSGELTVLERGSKGDATRGVPGMPPIAEDDASGAGPGA